MDLQFSDLESKIAHLLAAGYTQGEVAKKVHYSAKHTYDLVREIRKKVGARTINGLIVALFKKGYGKEERAIRERQFD
jgi:DNA-binding CsgD family transcriptional regulator